MSSQTDHKLELESQFILRLPQDKADTLREAIRTGEPLSDRFSIKFESDIRNGSVRLDNAEMPARLYDLPTIIESYKTLDRKNFYKTADVSQILICKDGPSSQQNTSDEIPDIDDKTRNDKLFASIGGAGKREFLYPHGITPPLKNVRKRRFRKTLKKKYVDFSEIEKEVKRLFKFDCEAIDSRYELIEENKLEKPQPSQYNDEMIAPSPIDGGPAGILSAENSQNIDIHELFGDECSSSDLSDEDDDDEDDEKDEDELEIDNDADIDEDNAVDEEMDDVDQDQSVPAADIAAELVAASDLISQSEEQEERRQELNKELNKVKERIQTQEIEMLGLDNLALRQRLQVVLDSLHEQESEILRKIDELG